MEVINLPWVHKIFGLHAQDDNEPKIREDGHLSSGIHCTSLAPDPLHPKASTIPFQQYQYKSRASERLQLLVGEM
eukprot:75359-Amphidinium_carterae.2